MRREAVTDDHRARPDARRRPARIRAQVGRRTRAAAEVEATRPPRPPFDQRTQLAVGRGSPSPSSAFSGSSSAPGRGTSRGVILIVAGLVAAGTAYVSSGARSAHRLLRHRDLILAGGTIPPCSAILSVAEILFDLDTSAPMAASSGSSSHSARHRGVVLYFAATQWWTGGPAAPWTAALASGDRATQARPHRRRPGPDRLARQRHDRDLVPAGRCRGHHAHPPRGARDARGCRS